MLGLLEKLKSEPGRMKVRTRRACTGRPSERGVVVEVEAGEQLQVPQAGRDGAAQLVVVQLQSPHLPPGARIPCQ